MGSSPISVAIFKPASHKALRVFYHASGAAAQTTRMPIVVFQGAYEATNAHPQAVKKLGDANHNEVWVDRRLVSVWLAAAVVADPLEAGCATRRQLVKEAASSGIEVCSGEVLHNIARVSGDRSPSEGLTESISKGCVRKLALTTTGWAIDPPEFAGRLPWFRTKLCIAPARWFLSSPNLRWAAAPAPRRCRCRRN